MTKDTRKSELMNHDPILSAPSDFEGVNPFTEINFQLKFPSSVQFRSKLVLEQGWAKISP
jgi:hypothetical protein